MSNQEVDLARVHVQAIESAGLEPSRFVSRGRRADAGDREWVRALVLRVGLVKASKAVGISRSALANILSDLNVYPGTLAVIREARQRAVATSAV